MIHGTRRARTILLPVAVLALLAALLAQASAATGQSPGGAEGCVPAWTLVPSANVPGGHNSLGKVAALSASDVWAVGDMVEGNNRNTLIEHWDGSAWSVVPSPNGPNAINFLLRVAAVASDDVWAVGYSRTPGFSGQSLTLIEHWDGSSWSVVPSPNAAPPGPYPWSNELFGIAVVAADDIWAVGQTWDFSGGQSLIVHWDGGSWSIVDNPHPGLHDVLYGVAAVASNDVWAVGNSYFDSLQQSVVEHWDGVSWTVVPSPNVGPFLNTFLSISATSANDVWAVGYHLAVFGANQVYQTSVLHWNGSAWSVVASPNMNQERNYLWDVVGISANDAWAVGFFDTGTELRTMPQHWDGVAWSIVPSPNDSTYISEIIGVAATSSTDVWAVGQAFDGFEFQTLVERYYCPVSGPPPTVTAIAPASGPASGGTPVTLTGADFAGGAAVSIGGSAAAGVVVNGATSIDAATPALSPGTLNDVVVTNPDTQSGTLTAGFFADFLDVPQGDGFHDFVEKLIRNDVTAGCGSGDYCRDTAVTRAQMAVFLLKAKLGFAHAPPACTGAVFNDVPCTGGTFDPWIEELAGLGITGGCQQTPALYCPDDPVNRQQMAVFLLKAKNGSAFDPPDCAGIFDDVPCTAGAGFADWIEQLFHDDVTGGCSTLPPLYCPVGPNTRGQMAVFLVKTFSLP